MAARPTQRCLARPWGARPALEDADAALRIKPESARGLRAAAFVRKKRGEWALAIADYEHARVLEPDIAYIYDRLTYLHFRNGDYDEAVSNREQAVAMDPSMRDLRIFVSADQVPPDDPGIDKLATAFVRRGVEHDDAGDANRAFDAFDEALKLNDKLASAYLRRGHIYRIKLKNYKKGSGRPGEGSSTRPGRRPNS